jgi:hypothetical protein
VRTDYRSGHYSDEMLEISSVAWRWCADRCCILIAVISARHTSDRLFRDLPFNENGEA